MNNEYCLIGIDSLCLASSDWASWVQAIGSIAAILVAIGIGIFQHRASLAVAKKIETDRRELVCVQALNVCEGHFVSLSRIWSLLSRYPAGIARQRAWVNIGTPETISPMDINSLTFLVVEKSQHALQIFSQINAMQILWDRLLNDLATAVRRTGVIDATELADRTQDLESLTIQDLRELPLKIQAVRTLLLKVHPNWSLPTTQFDQQPDTSRMEAMTGLNNPEMGRVVRPAGNNPSSV